MYIFLICALTIGSNYAIAQNQKIGFIDSEIIMEQMPEYSGIEQRLDLLSETWEQEIEQMERQLEELEADFEAREILFTDEIREQRLREIEHLQSELDQYVEDKFGPEGEYFTVQSELLEPVQRKIFEALNRVANRDNFDFIFDRAADTKYLFARQQWNLTDEVLLELDIDIDVDADTSGN